jgi:1-acyl-sn-glycerol-3-phosphate acyltransferase
VAICPPASFAGWAGLASLVAGLAFVGVGQGPEWVVASNTWPGWLMLGLGVAAQVYWLREWLELTAALPAFFLYRIRHGGPGRAWIPWRGPLLVIANHAAWFDPLWLGKVIPRRLTPMMTSDFYDLPGLYWLMRYVLRVIRVEEAHARREAPELDEAVKRLASGECVVIFPEGRLRREEDRMLAPFQRGIWYILQKSPDTPVVPCWIEGNWGSYFSWKDGPPMKNKPFDWCRRITIVVGYPRVLSGEVLADHRTTRRFLEQLVLEQRQYLHQK